MKNYDTGIMERVRPPRRGGLTIGMERDRRDVLAGITRYLRPARFWKPGRMVKKGGKHGD